jgi:alpha-tubulin suppressor-like RCC1 family protein
MPRAVPRRLEDAPSNTARGDALGADFDPASRGASHDARRDEAIDPETAADAVLHAQRRALLEARAILADAEQNARDEDLLLAEDVAHEHPEEAAKRAFAAGALKDDLATKSAWCAEPLRPTEEDVMKQRVYERVRKPKFRRRHAVHLYGDPDAFESLRLDAETETTDREKQRRFLYGEERRRKPRTVDDDDDDDDACGHNKVGGILSAVFGQGAGDPDGVPGVSVVPPSDSGVKATRTATILPGNTSQATATKSSATASVPTDAFRTKRAEVAALAAISAELERVPPHLRGRILPAELDIPEGARVVKIAGGDAHCAILLDTSRLIERVLPRHREHAGRVLMLGSNARGQLGLGDSFDRSIPATLTTLTDRTHYLAGRGGGGRVADHAAGDSLGGFSKPGGVRGAQDVAAGAAHTVLVTEDARAAAFGQDARGCLGQGESGLNRRFLLPRVMHWVSRSCTKVARCAAGLSHTVLLTADGRVLTLGDGANGRLGHGEDAPGGGFRSSSVPRRVAGLDGLRVVGVSCGRRHTLCVTESGLAYVWGANEAGQLGQGDRRDRASPARVRHEEWNGEADADADANADANANADADASPRDFDHGGRSRVFELQERLLGPLRGANARFIPHGEANRAFAQPTALQLETAALRREARLGIRRGEAEESEEARRVARGLAPSRPKKYAVVAAVGGDAHSAVLTAAGRVYTFGANDRGQLGRESAEAASPLNPRRRGGDVPGLVSALVNARVTHVSCGDAHAVARTALGDVFVWGANERGQCGDGVSVTDKLEPTPFVPRVSAEEARAAPRWRLERAAAHPMFGLTCESVFACGASTFAVVTGGHRVFACGAGVPFDDAKTSKRQSVKGNEPETTRPGEAFETRADSRDVVGGFAPTTTFSKMLAERLDDVENKRALVMESTVRMLTPDEGSFENLSEQMVAYAPYGELVLARAAKAILEETARKPAFALAYGSLLERLVKRKCVACPPSHFRRVLLLAVEDAGVRLLKRQEDAAHRRALETLGWARYQRGIAGGAGTHASFYDAVVDRESYAEYEAFRDECKALQGILRDLYEHRNLLLPDDLRDVAAGFPGSEHSVGVSDAAAAWRKATFFRGLTRWRSAGDDAAADATRAGAGAWLGHERRGLGRLAEGDEATVVKQRGVGDADPPVPRRGVDDAAWDGADGAGWEAYRGGDGDGDGDGDDAVSRFAYPRDRWESHFERRRGEEDTLDPVAVGVDARDAEAESLARLRREERA